MKKEVFLAISIGFALGLVITFGIWTANKSLKNLPARISPTPPSGETGTPSVPTPTALPTSQTSSLLTIISPENEALVDKNTVTISGTTTAAATITILSETGQDIVTANSNGNFSSTITLEGGYNRIKVTAFDKDGKSISQDLTVTYTTAKI